jgi:hypothetical protein
MIHNYVYAYVSIGFIRFFNYSSIVCHSMEKNEIGGACSAYGGGERRVQGFGGKT